jgi:Lipase (class 3)
MMRAFFRETSLELLAVTISLWLALPAAAQTDQPYQTVQFTIGSGSPGPSISAREFARIYAPYAVLATAAYEHVAGFNATRQQRLTRDGSPIGADVALAAGVFGQQGDQAQNLLRAWQYEFGHEGYLGCWDEKDGKCRARKARAATVSTAGLSFQVWALRSQNGPKGACSEVSIAFRGTQSTSYRDWLANLHWATRVLPRAFRPDDEYAQLGRNIDAIIGSVKALDCFARAGGRTRIVATGHSLGGGLAQFAALANAPTGTRIRKVFAFDPSPVTALDLIDPKIASANRAGLTIDRIYQKGEILSVYSTTYLKPETPPTSCNPLVRQVEFDAFAPEPPKSRLRRFVHRTAPSVYRVFSSADLHQIMPLASRLVAWSYDETGRRLREQVSLPPPSRGCNPDYIDRPPTAPVVAQLRGGRVIYVAQRFRRAPAESNYVAQRFRRAPAESNYVAQRFRRAPAESNYVAQRFRRAPAESNRFAWMISPH